mmetsp:Transcript_1396/g.2209  ORF Transcript_1396/g.2209 Transcript_1396/m.2209 type:complete len:162 (-) Transcript_1396:168-653(-)
MREHGGGAAKGVDMENVVVVVPETSSERSRIVVFAGMLANAVAKKSGVEWPVIAADANEAYKVARSHIVSFHVERDSGDDNYEGYSMVCNASSTYVHIKLTATKESALLPGVHRLISELRFRSHGGPQVWWSMPRLSISAGSSTFESVESFKPTLHRIILE